MKVRCIVILLVGIVSCVCASAQSWRWAKKSLVIEGIQTFPTKTVIDSRGNSIMLSIKLDRQILSKHDVNGTILWKREIFMVTQTNNSLTDICVDASDNIYVAIGAIVRIDRDTINSSSPYVLIKLNSSGRFKWSRAIDYQPFIFGPQLVYSANRIFLRVAIQAFKSLIYDGTTFVNQGGNTSCSFVASLDTAGKLKWAKKMYSPPQGITCGSSDVTPALSINKAGELLLVGVAMDKLKVDTVAVIDYPNACRSYVYGMLVDGTSGNIKWAKELALDSMSQQQNLLQISHRAQSTILSNGYFVVYKLIEQDTLGATPDSRAVRVSNKLYLFDNDGNLIRKDSNGQYGTGWHEMLQLVPGDHADFYSSGLWHSELGYLKTYEARKWDTTLNSVWKKNTEFNWLTPYFSSNNLYYRNRALSLLLQSGSESNNDEFAYFGADSLRPYLNNMYARMTDAENYISGWVYFDQNQNGIRDSNEPPAPHVMITNKNGDTIYAVSDSKGFYEIAASPGTYTLRPFNTKDIYPNHRLFSPASYSVTIDGYGNYIRNKNFALKQSRPVTDGQINITPVSPARPGRILVYRADIKNIGCTDFTGTYKVWYDQSKLTYKNSQQAPTDVSPPQLTFSVSNLAQFSSISNEIQFQVNTTAKLGDTIKIKAQLTVTPKDALLINNVDSAYVFVRTSYDPNMKEVLPLKDVNYDSVINGSQEVNYTIHFQNTGNDTAFAVLITDSLDSKLDLSSLRVISSSHPVNVLWNNPSSAQFYFPGIQLPDSSTDNLRSNGFVRFGIKPLSTVQLTDLVKNNSNIYFDYESPVETNGVITNFIIDRTGPSSGIDTTVSGGDTTTTVYKNNLEVSPVPTSGILHYRVNIDGFNEQMDLSIYDAGGRLVLNTVKQITGNVYQSTDLSRLNQGLYYLVLSGNGNRFLRKIVVQR